MQPPLPHPRVDDSGRFDAQEPLVEALVVEGEAGVVDAQQAWDGGVEVVDVFSPYFICA